MINLNYEGTVAEQALKLGTMNNVEPINKKLKILHLEDLPSDVELIGNALKRGGIDFERVVVETREQFLIALEGFVPDIILADHSLPSFDSHEALTIVLKKGINIPFLLITGAMSDEFAADIIKRGADDYILKDRLNRLPAAVQSSLEKFRVRNVQKKIREELLISEAQFRGAFEFSAIGMALVSTNGIWLKINNALCNMLGYDAGELLCRTFADITHPQDLDLDLPQMRQILRREIESYQTEKRYFNRNGSIVWVLLNVSLVMDQQGTPVHFIFQIENITDRKEMEDARIKYAILESKSKVMEQFAYIASHDLREPLLAIQSYISLIMEKDHANLDKDLLDI